MADDFPDLHHKLCKQLAALTTAIYHLNTKNDENDLTIQTYIQIYEQEMDNLVQSANQIITKHLQENAQAAELHEIHTSYKAFKTQIEEARASSVNEFNRFQENIWEKERAMQEEANKQVNMYKAEVDNLKEKIWHLQKLVEKVSGAEVKFDEEEQKAREKENQRVKKELEETQKQNEVLKANYSELEGLYRDLEENYAKVKGWGQDSLGSDPRSPKFEVEILRGKIADQEKLIMALRKTISQENGLYDGEYVASIEFEGNSNRDISNLGLQINNLQKEKVASERMLKEKEDEIDRLKDQLKENPSEDKFQQKMEEYENRLKEASREHRKMIEKLHNEYSETVAEMENNFERESVRWQTILQGMQATLDSRNEYINGLEERLRTIETEKEDLQQKAQETGRYEEKMASLNLEVERLNKTLNDTKTTYEQKLHDVKDKLEEEKMNALEAIKLESKLSLQALEGELNHRKTHLEAQKELKIKELEAEVEKLRQHPLQELEVKTKEIAEEYQNKVNELSKRHNAYVRELMEKHEKEVQQINKDHEKQLNGVKKEVQQEKDNMLKAKEDDKNSEVGKVKKDYEAKLKKISKSYDKQLEEKLHEYEAKLKSKDTEIGDLRKEIDSAKEELKTKLNMLEGKEASFKGLQKIVEDQKNTIELLQDEMREGFLEEGGSTFRNEISKIKDMDLSGRGKEDMMVNHLKYAERVDKKFKDLKKQYDEKVEILTQRYNELLAVFEMRPSRQEDMTKIKQLEEEIRKPAEKVKGAQVSGSETVRKEEYQVFNSHPNFGAATIMNTMRGGKKNQKTLSPSHMNSLPPISISQFSIQMRTPPAANPLTTTKKFFKCEACLSVL